MSATRDSMSRYWSVGRERRRSAYCGIERLEVGKLVPKRPGLHLRASCSMRMASRCTFRVRPRETAATATMSRVHSSEGPQIKQEEDGEYQRLRLSEL